LKPFYTILIIAFNCCISVASQGQKVEDIEFHLYTDSLKKGVHNYINVDGRFSDGRYLPLTDSDVTFSANTGKWDGNSLIIDSSYNKDSVVVTVALKQNPQVVKTITIYMKKNQQNEKLKTEDELYNEWQGKKKKRG
jgi:hypothetical protein